MANKYLDENGLLYLWSKITSIFVKKDGDKVLSTNDYTTAEKNKLAGIATGATANTGTVTSVTLKATSPIAIDSTSAITTSGTRTLSHANSGVTAASKGDTANQTPGFGGSFKALSGTVNATGHLTAFEEHTVTIPSAAASTSAAGLMSAADKTKLNGIATGAEVNQNAFAKVTVGSTTVEADAKSDTLTLAAGSNVTITPDATNDKITIAATDTTYSAATTSAAGLMSAADKTKLDGIAAGATAVTVDSAMSSSSTNPVQNKVINTALGAKAALASPTFTGTPKAPTAAAGTNSTQLATTAFVTTAVANAKVGAATFKGTVTAGTDISDLTAYSKGWYWVVKTAGTYVGQTCEPGDMIFCVSDYSSSYKAEDFSVIQNNLDIAAITNSEIDTIVAS